MAEIVFQNQDDIVDITEIEQMKRALDALDEIPYEPSGGVKMPDRESGSLTNNNNINTNRIFLLDVLSPQIKENERCKRIHKHFLLAAVGIFISTQFILLFILMSKTIYSIIECHKNGNPFSDQTIQLLFTGLGAYMTSIVVELIAMLYYIVKNVFDTSISGLVKAFKESKKTPIKK